MIELDSSNPGEKPKGATVIEAIENAGVFGITKRDDGRFEFEEHADYWLSAILTKNQMIMLAEELIAMANVKVSCAGTASAGLPGYAGDNNGE